ncbi:MAG TPA: TonB family protein [Ohtaekwangia sp.]|uniref:TonB family protein n=1 Tax=Ohtaekwangia sp. TaxID=2066019 RepID=UPI002F91DB40
MADLQHDIEKYLRGELSPAEMHALERRALSDPFLADALEGAAQLSPDDLSNDIKLLQASLKDRIAKEHVKVVPMWVWPARVAAGLVLLAVSGFIIFNLLQEKDTAQLAINTAKEEPAPKTDDVPPPVDSSAGSNSGAAEETDNDRFQPALAKPEEEKLAEPDQVAAQKSRSKTENAEAVATERAVAGEPAISSADKVGGQVSETDQQKVQEALESQESVASVPVQVPMMAKDIAVEKEAAEEAKRKADQNAYRPAEKKAAAADVRLRRYSSAPTNTRVIRGKVTSEDGLGLPGVNVMIKDSNVGTVTDAEGNYLVTTPDDSRELVFSFIGMQSKEAEATSDKLDVQLEQDVSQLSEVVVVGYGAEHNVEDDVTNVELAAPKGGRAAYKQYLETSMHYPEEALQNRIEGKVTIQFTVEPTGQLTDFKVLKGLGYGCDEEVIRLIKRGPKWIPTKKDDEAVKDRVKVRLRFRLPKK